MQIKGLPPAERPREQLLAHGPDVLAEAELLSLVLGCGSRRVSALELARRLVAEGSGLRPLARRTLAVWQTEEGVGEALGTRLVAVFEIARRLRTRAPRRGQAIRHPQQLASYFTGRLADAQVEIFGALLLDARNRLLVDEVLSRGGWSASVVRPREVFRRALLAGCASADPVPQSPFRRSGAEP